MSNELGCPIIKYGMGTKENPEVCVANLQWALNTVMVAGLVEDGVFGAKTQAAVRAYQQAKGLMADGIAGDQTQGALYADLASGTKISAQAIPIMKPPVIGAPVSTASTGLTIPGLGTINWTTVGIIAAVALAAYFIFGSGGFSFAEEPSTKRRRRK